MISKALGPGPPEEELSRCCTISIKREDMWTLKMSGWLNDQVRKIMKILIITFFCYQVVNSYMKLIAEANTDVYAYSTFFYTKLVNSGLQAVSRWTKETDLFTKRLLLAPVHLGNH